MVMFLSCPAFKALRTAYHFLIFPCNNPVKKGRLKKVTLLRSHCNQQHTKGEQWEWFTPGTGNGGAFVENCCWNAHCLHFFSGHDRYSVAICWKGSVAPCPWRGEGCKHLLCASISLLILLWIQPSISMCSAVFSAISPVTVLLE